MEQWKDWFSALNLCLIFHYLEYIHVALMILFPDVFTAMKYVWNIFFDVESLSVVWVTKKCHIKTLFQAFIAIYCKNQFETCLGYMGKFETKLQKTGAFYFSSRHGQASFGTSSLWPIISGNTMFQTSLILLLKLSWLQIFCIHFPKHSFLNLHIEVLAFLDTERKWDCLI